MVAGSPVESDLASCFEKLPEEMKLTLDEIDGPMRLGLCALIIAADRCGQVLLSIDEIAEALDAAGIHADREKLLRGFARAGKRLSRKEIDGVTKYKATITARRELGSYVSEGPIQLVYVKTGTPRTARKQLGGILEGLSGVVRILDPYYGKRTLDVLELIPDSCEVRFLTAKTTENEARLRRAISDFRKEHRATYMRIYPRPRNIHDRYIIDDRELLIIGHGLKDIGGRESFIIRIDESIAGGIVREIRESFDAKWEESSPIL